MRDFSNFSSDSFNDDLSKVNWNALFVNDSRDVNSVFSSFYNKCNKLINKHVPMKTISKRKAKLLSKPWITKGLRSSVRIKKTLYASGDMIQYKVYRNKLCSLIRLSKQKYYTKFFNDNLNNMKKTWQGIDDIPSGNSKNTKPIQFLKDPNDKYSISSEPRRNATIINEHFSLVGPNLANKLPPAQHSYLGFLNVSKTPVTSFAFELVIPNEVKQEISRIPNGKSHGLYSCPSKILKYSANVISSTLAQIINLSISTGVYPKKLKMAKIIPIFKADDNTDANNYKPISLLLNFNRIFEKLICNRMESFIENNNLFSPSQNGFCKAHSTQHAILDIVNTLQTNMDDHLLSCGVFIDLKKLSILLITKFFWISYIIMTFVVL